MDLTKITTPFGLLDAETQEALRAHFNSGGRILVYGGRVGWNEETQPTWFLAVVYRAASRPPVTSDDLAEALMWVLPLAKGYAASNRAAQNEEIVSIARDRLARYDAEKEGEA